jgi:hypothetical protein
VSFAAIILCVASQRVEYRYKLIFRIALRYGLGDRSSRVRFQAGAGNFSLHHRLQNGSGANPASWVPGALSLEVKRPRREADHSSQSSAKV